MAEPSVVDPPVKTLPRVKRAYTRSTPPRVPKQQPLPETVPLFPAISDTRKRAYVVTLSLTGDYGKAAKAAGVCPATGYNWRHDEEDFEFIKACHLAERIAGDRSEDELTRRAHATGDQRDTTALIFKLKTILPDKYRERPDESRYVRIEKVQAALAALSGSVNRRLTELLRTPDLPPSVQDAVSLALNGIQQDVLALTGRPEPAAAVEAR